VLLSNPDFNAMSHSQYRLHGDTHVIFEQPTKEDALEDTYKGGPTLANGIKEGLKAEDLTTIIE
jgi:hypothetical protein